MSVAERVAVLLVSTETPRRTSLGRHLHLLCITTRLIGPGARELLLKEGIVASLSCTKAVHAATC